MLSAKLFSKNLINLCHPLTYEIKEAQKERDGKFDPFFKFPILLRNGLSSHAVIPPADQNGWGWVLP